MNNSQKILRIHEASKNTWVAGTFCKIKYYYDRREFILWWIIDLGSFRKIDFEDDM